LDTRPATFGDLGATMTGTDEPSGFLSSSQAAPAAEPSPAARKVVLSVGIGIGPGRLHPQFQGADWREVRLDINPAVNPDIVAAITNMPVVASGTIDAVWSSHNLVQLYRHEVPLALGEFMRVLRPGGVVLLAVPDLQNIARLVVADRLEEAAYVSPSGPITPLDMIYGHSPSLARGQHVVAHRTGFTPTALLKALMQAGFVDILLERSNEFELSGRANKPRSPD
jgi:SAM-dependent methyltransferase